MIIFTSWSFSSVFQKRWQNNLKRTNCQLQLSVIFIVEMECQNTNYKKRMLPIFNSYFDEDWKNDLISVWNAAASSLLAAALFLCWSAVTLRWHTVHNVLKLSISHSPPPWATGVMWSACQNCKQIEKLTEEGNKWTIALSIKFKTNSRHKIYIGYFYPHVPVRFAEFWSFFLSLCSPNNHNDSPESIWHVLPCPLLFWKVRTTVF